MNTPAKTNQNIPMTMKETISRQDIKKRIEERLGQKAGTFMASILDLTGEDKNLALCNPNLVIKECLKAAALDLPVNKNLGFAYVIPYKGTPQFQMGYKGYIQLAIRTGQYRHLNAGVVYEGETMVVDRIRGTLTIEGEATSEKPTGYFCYMELINGFQKAIGWSVEKVMNHGKKFSKSFNNATSPWETNTEAMCLKTMIMQLVPKYGPMSIELTTAMSQDRSDVVPFDHAEAQISEHANQGDVIDIDSSEDTVKEPETIDGINGGEMTDAEKAEIMAMEAEAARQEQKEAEKEGPGF